VVLEADGDRLVATLDDTGTVTGLYEEASANV